LGHINSENKECCFYLQSTEAPNPFLRPGGNIGCMILVEKEKCRYGSACSRGRWSVKQYSSGGERYGKGRHGEHHWHLAEGNTTWINGENTYPFHKC